MNEQLQAILEKASKRLDLVTTGALMVMLIIAGYLFWQEQSYIPEETPPPPRKDWTLKLPLASQADKKVDEIYAGAVERVHGKFLNIQPKISEDPQASRLVRANMFDRRSAEREKEIEAEINRDYNRAEALFEETNYTEALNVVNGILDRNPSHRLTLDLKTRIETVMNPPAPEATPAQ